MSFIYSTSKKILLPFVIVIYLFLCFSYMIDVLFFLSYRHVSLSPDRYIYMFIYGFSPCCWSSRQFGNVLQYFVLLELVSELTMIVLVDTDYEPTLLKFTYFFLSIQNGCLRVNYSAVKIMWQWILWWWLMWNCKSEIRHEATKFCLTIFPKPECTSTLLWDTSGDRHVFQSITHPELKHKTQKWIYQTDNQTISALQNTIKIGYFSMYLCHWATAQIIVKCIAIAYLMMFGSAMSYISRSPGIFLIWTSPFFLQYYRQYRVSVRPCDIWVQRKNWVQRKKILILVKYISHIQRWSQI